MARLAISAILLVLALFLGVLALGFVAAALYLALATVTTPSLAALSAPGRYFWRGFC